jgi:hypothetical protein
MRSVSDNLVDGEPHLLRPFDEEQGLDVLFARRNKAAFLPILKLEAGRLEPAESGARTRTYLRDFEGFPVDSSTGVPRLSLCQ